MPDCARPADAWFVVGPALRAETQPAPPFQPIRQDDCFVAKLAVGACQGFRADDQSIAKRQRLFETLAYIGRHRFAMNTLQRQVGNEIVELEDAKGPAGI